MTCCYASLHDMIKRRPKGLLGMRLNYSHAMNRHEDPIEYDPALSLPAIYDAPTDLIPPARG